MVFRTDRIQAKLFLKCLEDISPFCGATDTSVLDFWWHLSWVSKPGWILSLARFVTCGQRNPNIHLWCDTCWPLYSQHGRTWCFKKKFLHFLFIFWKIIIRSSDRSGNLMVYFVNFSMSIFWICTSTFSKINFLLRRYIVEEQLDSQFLHKFYRLRTLNWKSPIQFLFKWLRYIKTLKMYRKIAILNQHHCFRLVWIGLNTENTCIIVVVLCDKHRRCELTRRFHDYRLEFWTKIPFMRSRRDAAIIRNNRRLYSVALAAIWTPPSPPTKPPTPLYHFPLYSQLTYGNLQKSTKLNINPDKSSDASDFSLQEILSNLICRRISLEASSTQS